MRIAYGVAVVAVVTALAAAQSYAGPAESAAKLEAAKKDPGARAQDRRSAIEAQTQASRKALEGFLALMAKHEFRAAVDRYTAKNYIQHDLGVPPGREGAIAYFKEELARGEQVSIDGMVAEGNMVGLHLHRKFGDGSPPVEVIEIWRVEGGRLAEHWGVNQKAADNAARRITK